LPELRAADVARARDLALVNRLDVRHALADYEVAEQTCARRRIAVSRPHAGAGYLLDQDQHKITLALDLPVPLNHGAKASIAGGRRRAVAAAKFDEVQAAALAAIDLGFAQYEASRGALAAAEQAEAAAAEAAASLQRRLAAGAADRGELLAGRIAVVGLKRSALDARRAALDAATRSRTASSARCSRVVDQTSAEIGGLLVGRRNDREARHRRVARDHRRLARRLPGAAAPDGAGDAAEHEAPEEGVALSADEQVRLGVEVAEVHAATYQPSVIGRAKVEDAQTVVDAMAALARAEANARTSRAALDRRATSSSSTRRCLRRSSRAPSGSPRRTIRSSDRRGRTPRSRSDHRSMARFGPSRAAARGAHRRLGAAREREFPFGFGGAAPASLTLRRLGGESGEDWTATSCGSAPRSCGAGPDDARAAARAARAELRRALDRGRRRRGAVPGLSCRRRPWCSRR